MYKIILPLLTVVAWLTYWVLKADKEVKKIKKETYNFPHFRKTLKEKYPKLKDSLIKKLYKK
jgi:hypothetical protein